MSDDDLDMGKTGRRLRQEQWDDVRCMKLRNEMLRMAECLGEEMACDLGRRSRCRIRDWRMEKRRGSHGGWESPAEQSGYDSVEGKIRRLTERIDEVEGREREKGEGRMVKGSSSESDEGTGRWRWDGRAWCRVEYKGSYNSRLSSRVPRAVKLRDRIDWLKSERENLRDGQNSMWASGASGSVRGSGFSRELEQPVHVDPGPELHQQLFSKFDDVNVSQDFWFGTFFRPGVRPGFRGWCLCWWP